jgi:hypothetical protein
MNSYADYSPSVSRFFLSDKIQFSNMTSTWKTALVSVSREVPTSEATITLAMCIRDHEVGTHLPAYRKPSRCQEALREFDSACKALLVGSQPQKLALPRSERVLAFENLNYSGPASSGLFVDPDRLHLLSAAVDLELESALVF